MVRAGFVRAPLGDRFRAFHHKRAAHRADASGRTRFDRVFALGIVGAGVEQAEFAAPLHHLSLLAERARDARFSLGLFCWVFLYELALRIVAACDKSSEAPFALDQLAGEIGRASCRER